MFEGTVQSKNSKLNENSKIKTDDESIIKLDCRKELLPENLSTSHEKEFYSSNNYSSETDLKTIIYALDSLKVSFIEFNTRMISVENKISTLDEKVTRLDERVSRLDDRVSRLESDTKEIKRKLNDSEWQAQALYKNMTQLNNNLDWQFEITVRKYIELSESINFARMSRVKNFEDFSQFFFCQCSPLLVNCLREANFDLLTTLQRK